MVRLLEVILAVAMFGDVLCKPVEETKDLDQKVHHLWKRFINPALASGFFNGNGLSKIRTKRKNEKQGMWKRFINPALASGFFNGNGLSKIRTKRNAAEDCEKLELCKLHASSPRNFLAAYELYFVNKENARLWDHHTHTMADCNSRFAHCFGADSAPKPKTNYKEFREDYGDTRSDYDDNY